MNLMAARWARLYRGTPAEIALEDAVAALGVPYRNQYPGFLYGLPYFPDFFLPTLGLVIEVDDKSHNEVDKRAADAERTEVLAARGWRVVRCTNREALEDPKGTVKRMLLSEGLWPVPRTPKLSECLPTVDRRKPTGRRKRS